MNVLSKPEAGGQRSSSSLLSSIMDLPNEMLERIFEYCGLESMKLLRALENRRILAVTRTCKTKHFKHWSLGQITAQRLRLFMKQVVILKGIKIVSLLGYSCEADGVVEALVDEREELESVEINGSQCTDKSLQLLLQHPKLKVVKLPESNVTGNIELLTSLAVEELDLSYCSKLTDTGLITFLNKTGENLRILDLCRTNVSLSNVDSLTTSFSQLEELKLSGCTNMTDTGLITFLNKTGENLRILNLYRTDVSMSNVESLTTSFSQLEELKLSGCRNMTDTGLITFLNKTGENLRILDLTGTDVSLSNVDFLTQRLVAANPDARAQ